MLTAKEIFDSLSESERQKRAETITAHDVYLCQSVLVDALLQRHIDGFLWEDIVNCEELNEETQEYESQEIFEWWAVSEWLALKLEAAGQPILRSDYGTWWGRTCTGQSFTIDYCVQMVACQLEADIQNDAAKVRRVGL